MAWTQADQMAYIAKRRADGTIIRVTVDVTQHTAQSWQAYADSKGLKRATMIRDCIARCMALDGYADAGELENVAPSTVQEVTRETEAENTKRKRGRPKKIKAD